MTGKSDLGMLYAFRRKDQIRAARLVSKAEIPMGEGASMMSIAGLLAETLVLPSFSCRTALSEFDTLVQCTLALRYPAASACASVQKIASGLVWS
jgi:hypothetical protein